MFKCNCGREFEKKRSLTSHARFCDQYVKVEKHVSIYKISDNLYRCECEREFDNHQSLNSHLSHCLIHCQALNKDKKRIETQKGIMCGWENKTEDDIKIIRQKASNTYCERIESGEINSSFKGRTHTEESRNKMSLSRQHALELSDTHCKWFEVSNGEKVIKVQGTWEMDVAETLTKNNIKWDRVTLVYDGHHRYTPDFYLPEHDMYIEVKGWWNDRDVNKMKKFLPYYENINLRVIEKLKNIKRFKKNELSVSDLKHIKDLVYFKNDQT